MQLGDIVTIRKGLPLERKKVSYYNDAKKSYKVFTLKTLNDILETNNYKFDNFLSGTKLDDQYLTQSGDILVRLRFPILAVSIDKHTEGLVVPAIMAILRIKDNKLTDNKFLSNYFNSDYIQNQLTKSIKGTTIPMVKVADLMRLEINLPTLSKQLKINKYLETANQEINLYQQLIIQKEKMKIEVFETFISSKRIKKQ